MTLQTTTRSCAACLLACVGFTLNAHAAEGTSAGEKPEPPLYRPFTLGIEGGTTGFGVYGSWRFANHWGARVGVDHMSYSDSGFVIGDVTYDAKVQLLSEPLTLDFYPWKNHSFHISAGLMFNQNRLTGTAYDTGRFGRDRTLEMTVEQQPVNPYLSVGGTFFYFDHAHHWAMGGELGVAYTGSPKISMTGYGLPANVVAWEEQNLRHDAERYEWWPVLKLTVTYSF